MKKANFKPKQIYDGPDEEFYTWNHKVIFEGKELNVGNAFKWGQKYIHNLKFKNPELKNAFFNSLPFLHFDENSNFYDGLNNQIVNYEITKVDEINYLILVSTDEMNVGRYQIYVEAILEFEDGEIIG
ncbi:MAG: hypothetical protein U0V04_09040 [Spirosomataceae bacterium]|jgi:hypothetical protein